MPSASRRALFSSGFAPGVAPGAALGVAPGVALAVAVAAVMVAHHPEVEAAIPKRMAGLALAVLTTAALGAGVLTGRRVVLRGGLPLAAFAAFAAFAALSALSLAWGSPVGLPLVSTLVVAVVLGAVAADVAPGGDATPFAELVAWFAGSATAAVILVQLAAGLRGVRLEGGQGNANWAGLLLALALLPAASLTLRARGVGRAVAAVGLASMVVGLVVTESRTAWLAAAVGLGLAAALALRRRSAPVAAVDGARAAAVNGARAVAVDGVLVAAPFLVAVAGTAVAIFVAARLGPDGGTPSAIAGRGLIWLATAEVAVVRFPLGTGIGAFPADYLAAQAERLASLPVAVAALRFHDVDDAHHEWLHALATVGPLGAALLAVALGASLAGAVRARRAGHAGAMAAAIVAMSGDVLLARPACALLLGALLATGASPLASKPGPARRPPGWLAGPVRGPWFWLASLAFAGVLLSVEVASFRAGLDAMRARTAPLAERQARLERAFLADPRSPAHGVALGISRLEAGDAEGAQRALAAAIALRPSVGALVALGNAHASLGDLAAARRAYERAVALAPASFRAHAALAAALLDAGELDAGDLGAGDLDAAARHLAAARAVLPGEPSVAELAERLRRARLDHATGR